MAMFKVSEREHPPLQMPRRTMCKAQQQACHKLWQGELARIYGNLANHGMIYPSDRVNGSNGQMARLETYRQFRRRFRPYPCASFAYQPMFGGAVKGMFLGIEPDGYCHT